MRPLELVFLFLCVWFVNARKYTPQDLDEAKAKEIFMCMDEVSCVEKKAVELRKIADAAEESPEVIRDVYDAISAYGFEPEHTDESWMALSDLICDMEYAERLSRFGDFGTQMARYFKGQNCEVPEVESEYCSAMEKVFDASFGLVQKFTDLGVCNNPERMARQVRGKIGEAFG